MSRGTTQAKGLKLPCWVVRNLTNNDWRCLTCNKTMDSSLGFMQVCPSLTESKDADESA